MLLDSVYDPNALTEEDVEVFLTPLREPARARALSPADKLDRPDGEPLVGRELRAATLGEEGHPCRDQPAP